MRLPNNEPNSILVVTTPDHGVNGFVYSKFGNITEPDKYKLIKAKTVDNFYLPAGYVDQIREQYDDNLARCYLEGEWVSFALNKVFEHFNRNTHHKDNTEFGIGYGEVITETVLCSADFNIQDSVSCHAIQRGEHIHFFKETFHYDTRAMAQELKAMYPNNYVEMYVDGSGGNRHTSSTNTDHEILEHYGLIVMTKGANPRIRDRVNSGNLAFYNNKISIDTNACPKLTAALELHAYDDKGQPEKFHKHDKGAIDDWTDSATYLIHALLPVNKPQISISRY